MLTEAVAISVNSSFPQFDCQSSTLVAADDDAEMRRYASTCKLKQQRKHCKSVNIILGWPDQAIEVMQL